MSQTSIITGQYVCIHQTAATVVQRLLAWILDMILINIALMIVTFSIFQALSPYLNETLYTILSILITIAYLSYPFVMEVFNHGQSIGKYIVGIKVTSLDGTTPSIGAYMLRWLFLIIDWGMLGVGLASIVFTKNSQRLGDLAAGTTVVKLRKHSPSINTYGLNFVDGRYTPTYPEAANLSLQQFNVIVRTLYTQNENRNYNIARLAEKTEQVLGIKSREQNNQLFLQKIYNDFQYYASRVV